ncbi:MAG: hypothetical protein R3B06_13120 [Kofleriaceae bacterium]
MRWLAALVLVAAVSPARADYVVDFEPPPPVPTDFWSEVLHPNAQQVAEHHQSLERALDQLADPYLDERSRTALIGAGRQLAGYTYRLDPLDLDSAFLAGAFAEAGGQTVAAEGFLRQYLAAAPAGVRRADALVLVGRIALRQGHLEEAIAALRVAAAQPADLHRRTRARIALAHALEAAGDVTAAVAALRDLKEANPATGELPGFAAYLALAVIYDRDDQVALAADTLARMRAPISGDYQRTIDEVLRWFPPPIATDAHYYRALAVDGTPFAERDAYRAWLAYERSGAPAAARAAEHRRAADLALRRLRHPGPARRSAR